MDGDRVRNKVRVEVRVEVRVKVRVGVEVKVRVEVRVLLRSREKYLLRKLSKLYKLSFTLISLFCMDNVFHYFSFVASVSSALIFLDVAMQIQIGGQLYRMETRERILSYPMGPFY